MQHEKTTHKTSLIVTADQQPVDESALVNHAVAEPAAFALLYDHYFPLVHKYVYYRLRDAKTTDDLVSQIFERVLKSLGHYRSNEAPFGAWLFGIARHVVGDHFRTEKRHRWLSLEGLRYLTSSDLPPEEIALQSELSERLRAALGLLTDRERDLVGLKFASGLNNRHIAALTGLSESNVGIILFRAMQHLRADMMKEEVSHE